MVLTSARHCDGELRYSPVDVAVTANRQAPTTTILVSAEATIIVGGEWKTGERERERVESRALQTDLTGPTDRQILNCRLSVSLNIYGCASLLYSPGSKCNIDVEKVHTMPTDNRSVTVMSRADVGNPMWRSDAGVVRDMWLLPRRGQQ